MSPLFVFDQSGEWGVGVPSQYPHAKLFDKNIKIIWMYGQPQAKAKAKAMPGRLYIHTK